MLRKKWIWRGKCFRHLYLVALIFGGLIWWARYAQWAWVSLLTHSLEPKTDGPVHSAVRWLQRLGSPEYWFRGEQITPGLSAYTRGRPGTQPWFEWDMCFTLLIAPALIAAIGFFVGSRQQRDDLPATRRCRPAALAAASVLGGACLTALALKAITHTELDILLTRSSPAKIPMIALGLCAASAGFAAVTWRYVVASDGYWRLERVSRLVLILGTVSWGTSWITSPGPFRLLRRRFYSIDITEILCFTGSTAVLWAGAVRLILLWRFDRYRVRRQEVLAHRPHCIDCGYDLRGSLASRMHDQHAPVRRVTCPECGAGVSSEVVKIFRDGRHPAG